MFANFCLYSNFQRYKDIYMYIGALLNHKTVKLLFGGPLWTLFELFSENLKTSARFYLRNGIQAHCLLFRERYFDTLFRGIKALIFILDVRNYMYSFCALHVAKLKAMLSQERLVCIKTLENETMAEGSLATD